MSKQPLAEVFGFPIENHSERAQHYRQNQLCPYHNRVPNCTKDKAKDPLGVCSIVDANDQLAITCPIRFRQDWIITQDAADFFFPAGTKWTSLTEVRLTDRNGSSAGNIDVVLVAYDAQGQITDFGMIEIQAVYISGNVRRPFAAYMQSIQSGDTFDWTSTRHSPRPDYLSSSRKRLVPQLMYKGGILKAWGKPQAVVLHSNFFATLPNLPEVDEAEADVVWLVYDLPFDSSQSSYTLKLQRKLYTKFQGALDRIALPQPGSLDVFTDSLQDKLDAHLENDQYPPDAPTLSDLLG